MRVGKLLKLIFSYFTNLSLTEPIIKYSAKNTRREKQKRMFILGLFFVFICGRDGGEIIFLIGQKVFPFSSGT